MTIRFACPCGQPLVAADAFAGQRVRCTVCGNSQVVPGETVAAGPVIAPMGMVRFACEGCGQSCQALPEHAGKNTRCAHCGTVLVIPGGEHGTDSRRADALQAERPLAPLVARADLGAGGPRRWRSLRKSRKRTWIVLAGAVLLLGGGLALFLLRSGPSGDFDLVPRDAQGFVTVRMAALLQTPLGRDVRATLGAQALAPLEEVARDVGVEVHDVERVTVVLADADRDIFWVILKTVGPCDRNRVLRAEGRQFAEAEHVGKRYYRTGLVACYFAGARVLVFGSEAGVRRCLEQPKKPRSGPLDEALRAASKAGNQFAAGSNVPTDLTSRVQTGLGNRFGARTLLDRLAPLFAARTAWVTAAVAEDVDWEMTLTFSDRDAAHKGETAAAALLDLVVKTPPFLIRPGLERMGASPDEAEQELAALALAQKHLEQVKPKQSGNKVHLGGKVRGSDLLRTLADARKKIERRR